MLGLSLQTLNIVLQSHAGKVVERSWYQRSKHIFPASRWEVSFAFLRGPKLGLSDQSDV